MSRDALIDEVVQRTGRTRAHVKDMVERVLDADPFIYERELHRDPGTVGLILGLATGRIERRGQPTDTTDSTALTPPA